MIHDRYQWFKSQEYSILEDFSMSCSLEIFTLMHPELKTSEFLYEFSKQNKPDCEHPFQNSFLFLPTLFKFTSNGELWWPAPTGVFLCKWTHFVCALQIHGNKIMQGKTGEKQCSLYGSLAPECSVNYLWKCWQKRSRLNKARFSGGQHQPTLRWSLVCLAAPGF